jgi:acetolactate synthase-1/2/3 large subunit
MSSHTAEPAPAGSGQVSGGDAVAEALAQLGVEHVFGVASIHNLPIYDALARAGRVEAVAVRHEQAAVHAADAYARATGRLGVAITSTGPGAANAMGGLFEASVANSPVLMVTGQVETRLLGQGRGPTHEADRQREMLGTLTRRTESVRRGQDIKQVLFDVVRDMRTGRPQPGAVEIPIDLQYERSAPSAAEPWPLLRLPVDPAQLERAAELLRSAERPLIWAGGGVIRAGAGSAVTALAERLQAPVVMTVEGRGGIADDSPLSLGATTEFEDMAEVLGQADVVLALGTRFRAAATRHGALSLPGRLVHVDVDASVFGRVYRPEVAMAADLLLTVTALTSLLDEHSGTRPYAQLARDTSREVAERELARIGPDHLQIMETIRALLPRDGNLVRDSTVPAYLWADRLLPVLTPGTSIRPVSVAIGPGLPLAIGAAVGTGRPTVLVQGDGGLMLSLGELATVAQYGVPIVVCVFNDHGYGVLRAIEENHFSGRQFGVDLATPDFVALAAAMGVPSAAVDSADSFRSAFGAALDRGGPTLLEIDMRALSPMKLPAW